MLVPNPVLVKENKIAPIGLDQTLGDELMLGNISPCEFSLPAIPFDTYILAKVMPKYVRDNHLWKTFHFKLLYVIPSITFGFDVMFLTYN